MCIFSLIIFQQPVVCCGVDPQWHWINQCLRHVFMWELREKVGEVLFCFLLRLTLKSQAALYSPFRTWQLFPKILRLAAAFWEDSCDFTVEFCKVPVANLACLWQERCHWHVLSFQVWLFHQKPESLNPLTKYLSFTTGFGTNYVKGQKVSWFVLSCGRCCQSDTPDPWRWQMSRTALCLSLHSGVLRVCFIAFCSLQSQSIFFPLSHSYLCFCWCLHILQTPPSSQSSVSL